MFTLNKFLVGAVFAVVTGRVVAQELLDCGSSQYYASEYTCFNDTFLCPVQSGIRYLRCGDACYSPNQYTCENDALELYNPTNPDQLFDCGTAQYDPSDYVCYDGDFLCPKSDTVPTLRCGDACYSPSLYTCSAGHLAPNPGSPDCIPNYGTNEVCNDKGCVLLPCCPGLLSIASKCRDPCELSPSSCSP
ncbi:hypothetical protein MKEN_00995300 [Mycena kentingensis (nom. inval.)]|nr:hypothetical protein MKEN_00995300 [Mycena kentingensis (nom. inval.)]